MFLCLLSYNFIQHNIPCTSQRGIAFPLWKPLLLKQQYPVRVTWRFLSKSGGCRPLTRFYGNRKIVLKRRMASLNSVRPRCLQPRVCRNSSGKLLSHPFAGLTALRGVPPRELPAGCIKEFCNSPLKISDNSFPRQSIFTYTYWEYIYIIKHKYTTVNKCCLYPPCKKSLLCYIRLTTLF